MAITPKDFVATGGTGGTVKTTVFSPAAGSSIRITGICATGGASGGTLALFVNNGTADFTLIDTISISANDSVDLTVEKPVNILSGWTLKASIGEGVTLSISGEEM